MAFCDMGEIEHALQTGVITMHTKIKGRVHTFDEKGNYVTKIVETTPGRMIIGRLLPKDKAVPFEVCQPADDQEDDLQDDRHGLPRLRSEGDGHLLRPHHGSGLQACLPRRHLVRQGRHGYPGRPSTTIVEAARKQVEEFEQQYNDGLITQGEKYNKVVDAWAKCGDKIAEEMMKGIAAVQIDPETGRQKPINSVYMMSHSGARGSPAADEAARRHARPDGASGRLDHRDPDHGQLQGRPQRSRVLQLHPRRPQGSRGHGAEDRELGLPDPPSRRRGAGLDHCRARLRHRAWPHHGADRRCRSGRCDHRPAHPRPYHG